MKKSLKEKAFEDLSKKKESHSKMNGVEYENFEVQKYLKSKSSLKNEDKYILFKLCQQVVLHQHISHKKK